MENINFIPANELPVAEGDEVSVLCLENGEMKQKPATGLGGGNYDAVIKIEEDYGNGNDVCNITVEKGSLDDVVDMIRAGEKPKVLFYGVLYYGQALPIATEVNNMIVFDNEETGQTELNFMIFWMYGSGWTYQYNYKWTPNGVECF